MGLSLNQSLQPPRLRQRVLGAGMPPDMEEDPSAALPPGLSSGMAEPVAPERLRDTVLRSFGAGLQGQARPIRQNAPGAPAQPQTSLKQRILGALAGAGGGFLNAAFLQPPSREFSGQRWETSPEFAEQSRERQMQEQERLRAMNEASLLQRMQVSQAGAEARQRLGLEASDVRQQRALEAQGQRTREMIDVATQHQVAGFAQAEATAGRRMEHEDAMQLTRFAQQNRIEDMRERRGEEHDRRMLDISAEKNAVAQFKKPLADYNTAEENYRLMAGIAGDIQHQLDASGKDSISGPEAATLVARHMRINFPQGTGMRQSIQMIRFHLAQRGIEQKFEALLNHLETGADLSRAQVRGFVDLADRARLDSWATIQRLRQAYPGAETGANFDALAPETPIYEPKSGALIGWSTDGGRTMRPVR